MSHAPFLGEARTLTRRILIGVAIATALFVFVHDGWRLAQKTAADGENDFEISWKCARAALAGEDVYAIEGGGYTYLPPFYVVTAPLGLLPLVPAAILWHAIKCAVLAWVFVALWRMLAPHSHRHRALALAVAAAGAARALSGDLQLGQTNTFVLAFLTLAASAFATRRDFLAGAAVACATLIKVTPAIFLLYFFWKRSTRALPGAAAVLIVLGGALPALYFGPAQTADLYRRFHERIVAPTLDQSALRRADRSMAGQSLAPILHRYLTPMYATTADRAQDERLRINFASLDERTVAWLVLAAQIALVLAMLALTPRRRRECPDGARVLLEAGLVAAAMLLAAPYARKAHFVTAALAFAGCASAALSARARTAGAAIAVAALITGITSPEVLGRQLADRIEAYGPFTAATLILFAVAAALLRSAARRETGAAPVAAPQRERVTE